MRRQTFDFLWTYPGQWVLFFIALANVVAAVICVLNSLFAETPAEALKRGIPMPSQWEAGVLNHDHYFEWYSITQHPIWFVASVAWLLVALVAVLYLQRELRQ